MEAEDYLDPLFPFALEDLVGSEKFNSSSPIIGTTIPCPTDTTMTIDLNRSNTNLSITNSTLSTSQLSLRGPNNSDLQSSEQLPDVSINSTPSQQFSDGQLRTAVSSKLKCLYKEPRELSQYQENMKKFERLKPIFLKYLAKKRVEQSEKDKKLRAKYIKLLTKWRRKLQQIKQQQRQARLEEEIKRQIADRGTGIFNSIQANACLCEMRRTIFLI
jgi:DNA-directed RNA polymerase beta' subunit